MDVLSSSVKVALSASINDFTIGRHFRPDAGLVAKNLVSLNMSVAGPFHDFNAAGIFDICSMTAM